jgi:signal transduction histidine kinase
VTCSFKRRHPVLIADRSLASRLYNVAQEAVANAAEHSGADTVTIVLSANAGAAMLSIHDDGAGIDAAVARRREGPGLRAMERYARAIGGTLDIRSSAEGGTTVTCTFPREQ